MLQQILQTLRTTISHNFSTLVAQSIITKTSAIKYSTIGEFTHSLTLEELKFLCELLFVRLNVIDTIGRYGKILDHWHHLFLIWQCICGSNYHTAFMNKSESEKTTKVLYAEAIGFLCEELSRGKKLKKFEQLDFLTRECMKANWLDITA